MPDIRIPAIILFRARLNGRTGTGAGIVDGVTTEAVVIADLVARTATAGASIVDGVATEAVATDAVAAEKGVHEYDIQETSTILW